MKETTPGSLLRDLGRSYFAARFGPANVDRKDPLRWILDLPLENPRDVESNLAGDWLLVDSATAPLFHKIRSLEGAPVLRAHTDRGIQPAGSLREGSLALAFDPWLALGAGLAGMADGAIGSSPLDHLRENLWVDRLASRLAGLLNEAGATIRSGPRWPGAAPFAICLTHDVDRTRKTFQYVTHLGRRKGLRGARPTRRSGRAYWGFDEIRRIEEGAGVRSTFYVLHEGPEFHRASLRNRLLRWGLADFMAPGIADTVRSLSADGWEVGLHASLASVRNPRRIREETSLLREILGSEPLGVRQHYLELDLPNRWEEFSAAGFHYDSSFGLRDRFGFRGGTCFPFALWGRERVLPLLEIPLHLMDATLADERDPKATCLRLMDAVQAEGGVLTLLFHQRYYDPANFPGYSELYEEILDEAHRRGAWIARARDVAEAWSA